MTRPPVSVVMPFAGDAGAAMEAAQALRALRTRPGDELILVDNSGVASPSEEVVVLQATGERSPAHARNAGAARASCEWILFLDSDCRAATTLLEDYFAEPVGDQVGALVGEIVPAPELATLAGRYGAARNFLDQRAHLAHPYLPRAAAANLLVRAEAFWGVGGFLEGLRAAEDTDFSWRLQRAGWRLELRPQARAQHVYRASVGELRRQWRSYAAGRAWLARRYQGFTPQPALARVPRRLARLVRLRRPAGECQGPTAPQCTQPPRGQPRSPAERARHLSLDVLLAAEELRGLAQSNRPTPTSRSSPAHVVLVAERFPVQGDPLVELARTLEGARVEAVSRPERGALDTAGIAVSYREDDGAAERARALVALVLRHPLRCVRDALRSERHTRRAPLRAVAPAARRLERERGAQVHPLGGPPARILAARLALLTGRPMSGEGS